MVMNILLFLLAVLNYVHFSTAGLNYTSIRFTLVNPDFKTVDLTDNTNATGLFEEDSEIILLIFAWTEDTTTPWIKNITEAYHRRNDRKYQIIYVDWSYEGSTFYYHEVKIIDAIGYFSGDWLIRFMEKEKVDINRIHVLTHSLGCHLAGFMAKYIKKQLNRILHRITCLDAAAPGYLESSTQKKLYRGDAKIIVAIHTDIDNYGLAEAYGDIDFYPNGGLYHQPGCNDSFLESCSHCKSHDYWVEAIFSNKFYGRECDSWENYLEGLCENNRLLNFAGNMTSITIADSGIYFTYTNAEEPFLTNCIIKYDNYYDINDNYF
ncbi:hypothetical protein WA026_009187 [Henosepilachna vigintioctopunctata]|uniref:Lipase domain-containing protein n=1 Tax=Henosepilachna vigintioctopunctata TaxID=420089 RepID=A0AAW1UMY9_9CUCU